MGQEPRVTSGLLSCTCVVERPETRARHNSKDLRFKLLRIKRITSDSLKPNCIAIASKGVLSSHAISIILDALSSDNVISVLTGYGLVSYGFDTDMLLCVLWLWFSVISI